MIRILPTGSPLPTKQDMRKEFQELEDLDYPKRQPLIQTRAKQLFYLIDLIGFMAYRGWRRHKVRRDIK